MLQDNGKLYIYIFLIDKPVLENRKNEIPSTDEDDQINLLLLYSFFFFFFLDEGRMIRSTVLLLLLLHSFHRIFFKEGEEEAEGT